MTRSRSRWNSVRPGAGLRMAPATRPRRSPNAGSQRLRLTALRRRTGIRSGAMASGAAGVDHLSHQGVGRTHHRATRPVDPGTKRMSPSGAFLSTRIGAR